MVARTWFRTLLALALVVGPWRHVAQAAPAATSPATATTPAPLLQVTLGTAPRPTTPQLGAGTPASSAMRLKVTHFRRIMVYSGKNGGY